LKILKIPQTKSPQLNIFLTFEKYTKTLTCFEVICQTKNIKAQEL
jgi:hypothetical protein